MLKKTEKFITDIRKLQEHHKHIILWISFIVIFGFILTMWVGSLSEKLVLNTDEFNVFTAGGIKEELNKLNNKDEQKEIKDFSLFPFDY
ncbi:MAG: hypothetical protein AAB593_01875 [Patescibacteria group bacterium]